MVLRMSGLSVEFGQLRAVRGVDLSLTAGETLGIVGPNMAGKSSLLAAIAGLQRPTAGRIEIELAEGRFEDVTDMAAEERLRRHRVYLSPEASGVFRSLSVEENLLLTPRLLGLDGIGGDLEEVYARFPLLAERRRLSARFLSGGWRQILAVCRAQMVHPRLLLCDEPCLGLSPPMAALVLDTLAKTTNPDGERASLLLTDQNADRLRGAVDSLRTLDRGSLVATNEDSTAEEGNPH